MTRTLSTRSRRRCSRLRVVAFDPIGRPLPTARDERRRGPPRRRLAVDRVARLLRQGPRPRLGGHPGARAPAARELGYRPNVAAQALRLGTSRAVALLVPDVTNPFFGRVLRGAQRAAQAAGYTVALVDTGNDRRWEAQSFEALRAGPVDGYLLFEVSAPEALGPDQHVVLMETEAPGRPSVRFDAEGGAAAAFRHLLELGPPAHRPPRRRLRRADLPPARGRPPARAGRGRPGPRRTQPRAATTPIGIEDGARGGRPPARRAADRRVLRRRRHRRRALPGRARARAAHPRRPVRRRLRRHGLRARARAAAHHGRPRRRALGATAFELLWQPARCSP